MGDKIDYHLARFTAGLQEGQRREAWETDRPKRAVRREREGRNSRILYHIGKSPPIPRPAHSEHARRSGRGKGEGRDSSDEGAWIRKGRKPTSSGVFLTNNPRRVADHHGVFGHVYAYRVPEHVIQKSGGIQTFDRATELLIPHEHWHHVEFLGKSRSKSKFRDETRQTPEHIRYAGLFKKMDREDRDERAKSAQTPSSDNADSEYKPLSIGRRDYGNRGDQFAKRRKKTPKLREGVDGMNHQAKTLIQLEMMGFLRSAVKRVLPSTPVKKVRKLSPPSGETPTSGLLATQARLRDLEKERSETAQRKKENKDRGDRIRKLVRGESTLVGRTPLLVETACDTRRPNKPWRTSGGSKKFAVCASEGGKSKLVRFGDPGLSIKRHRKGRRKNFRARHGCGVRPNTKTKLKAGYWSCKTWEKKKTVGDVVGESYRDQIAGGVGDNSKPSDFDPKQLAMGIDVELEHTNSRAIAREIAIDHLREDPRYYSKLKKIHSESRTLRALSGVTEQQAVPTDPKIRAKAKKHIGYPPPGMIRMSAYPAGEGKGPKGKGVDAQYPDTPEGRKIADAQAWLYPSKRASAGKKVFEY